MIPRPEWTIRNPAPSGVLQGATRKAIARVIVTGQTYVLLANAERWALEASFQYDGFTANDPIANGTADGMQDAMVRAHQALVEQVTAEYCAG